MIIILCIVLLSIFIATAVGLAVSFKKPITGTPWFHSIDVENEVEEINGQVR